MNPPELSEVEEPATAHSEKEAQLGAEEKRRGQSKATANEAEITTR
jgi:hypothetical protein